MRNAEEITGGKVIVYDAIIIFLFSVGIDIALRYLTKRLGKRRVIKITEQGVFYKLPFEGENSITWDRVKAIKLSLIKGIGIFWSRGEKTNFWTLKCSIRDRLYIDRSFTEFSDTVRLVMEKSVNAVIDPRIRQFLQTSDARKLLTLKKMYGLFFLLMFGLAVFMLSKLVFADNGWSFLLLAGFASICGIFSFAGRLFSLIMLKWDDDKWILLSDVCLLVGSFLFFYIVFLLTTTGMVLIRVMLGLVSLMLSVCIVVLFPGLKKKHILHIFLLGSLFVYSIGNASFFDSRIKMHMLQSVNNFRGSAIGWFPDSSKIYIVGQECTDIENEDGQEKILIFDVVTRKLIKTILTKGVVGSLSFRWSPDGSKLALVEYSKDNPATLSLLDSKTLQKEFLLSEKSIGLFADGCWNQDGNKLAGTYLKEKEGGEEKRVAFVIDIHTKQITLFEEKNKILDAFWFFDDTLGLLNYDIKGTRQKDKLFKYSITRIRENGDKEVVYTAKEWCKGGAISPHGSFLVEKTQEGYPLFIDLFGKNQNIPFRKELDYNSSWYPGVYWAPNEKHVVLLFKEGAEKSTMCVYEPQSRESKEILSGGAKISGFSVKWSADSRWFLSCLEAARFPSPLLFSQDGDELIRITGAGSFISGFGISEFVPNYDCTKVVYLDFPIFKFPNKKFGTTTDILMAEIRK